MRFDVVALVVGLLASVACGSETTPIRDDAGVLRDAQVPADAGGAEATPGHELTGASGRMTGPTYTLDVQLGHPFSQQPIQGPTRRLEGNAPVKP
jgi:hypothetical protein